MHLAPGNYVLMCATTIGVAMDSNQTWKKSGQRGALAICRSGGRPRVLGDRTVCIVNEMGLSRLSTNLECLREHRDCLNTDQESV